MRVRYAFIAEHRNEFRITAMYHVLKVTRSGFYAWLAEPQSDRDRAKDSEQLLGLIRKYWQDSQGAYGSPRIHRDLRDAGELVSENRVARLMREHRVRALRRTARPRFMAGKATVIAPNRLQQQFSVAAADMVWATDITYIRTAEGWLYLGVVVDLYSRMVIGWSMQPALARGLVLGALLMAVWRRHPGKSVTMHSDQGIQYSSEDWMRFCKEHRLEVSMSRRGNCYESEHASDAVAESFFSSLKKERVRSRIYRTREEARADLFDYIEVFYNRTRRHSHLGNIGPVEYEMQASKRT